MQWKSVKEKNQLNPVWILPDDQYDYNNYDNENAFHLLLNWSMFLPYCKIE